MYWNKFFIIFSKKLKKFQFFFWGPTSGWPAASRAPKTPKWKSWDGYTSYYKTKYEIQWGKRFSFERRGGHGRRITTCLYWHFVKEFSCKLLAAGWRPAGGRLPAGCQPAASQVQKTTKWIPQKLIIILQPRPPLRSKENLFSHWVTYLVL